MKQEFARRKSVPGLLVSIVRFLRDLDALGQKHEDFDAFAAAHPVQETSSRGGRAIVLTVLRSPGGSETLSLRPFYNEIEAYFRSDQKRFDYPNMGPHATQAWSEYRHWIDALLGMPDADADRVEQEAIAFVLRELPSFEVDVSQLKPLSRRFSQLLESFDLTAQRGEPRGGAFQGIVYGYIRADAPHLHLDIAKVGAGSRRLQRVGDVDGWQGEHLVLSAEVKHLHITARQLDDLAAFASEVTRRNALGLIVAESFDEEARNALTEQGLRAVDLETLIEMVDIWDPLKQDAAVDAFAYYVCHIEKRMPLIERMKAFLQELDSAPRDADA